MRFDTSKFITLSCVPVGVVVLMSALLDYRCDSLTVATQRTEVER